MIKHLNKSKTISVKTFALVLLSSAIICISFFSVAYAKKNSKFPPINTTKPKAKPKITEFSKVKKWHKLDEGILKTIRTNKGKLCFSNKYVFADNKSLLWSKAKSKSYITFDVNLHKKYSLQFFLALLDAKGKKRKFRVDFLDSKEKSIFSYTFKTRRRWWNHTQFRANINKPNHIGQTYNIWKPTSNLITDKVRKCRITVLSGKGSIYIGVISVLPNYKNEHARKSADFRMDTGADGTNPKNQIPLFSPPKATPNEIRDIKKISKRLDRLFEINTPVSHAIGLPKKDFESICSRYKKLKLKRTAWAMTGENITIIPNYTSWASRESDWAELFSDISQGYWKSDSRIQRKQLEHMFIMMFDFHWYLGGMPDSWHGSGYKYVSSLYAMRKILTRHKRLTQAVIDNLAMRLELGKMYHEVGRKYKGLDIDYLRMRLLDYPMFIVMNPDLNDNVHNMKQLKKWLDDIVFQYSPGVEDGFKPDGTTYHHWGFLDFYGKTAVNASAQAIWLLSKTKFAVNKRSHKLIRNLVFKHNFYNPFTIHPPNLSGKFFNPKRYGGTGEYLGTQLGYLALAGLPDRKKKIDKKALALYLRNVELFQTRLKLPLRTNLYIYKQAKKIAKRYGIKPADFPTGHLTMNWGAAAIHRINGWTAVLKLHSKYQYEAESYNYSTYLGYGSLLFFNNTWKRYYSLKLCFDMGNPGWDWRLIPGTTVVNWPFEKVKKKDYKRYYAEQTFCGGVSQKDNGISAIKIIGSKKQGLKSFRAQKSYFFFGNKIVCLGNSIENNISDAHTVTTLFQSSISPKSIVNICGNSFTKNLKIQSFTSNDYNYLIDPHNHGYYIFPDQLFKVKIGNQSSPDADDKRILKGNFAYAYLDHGKAQKNTPLKNKSYKYIILPFSKATSVQEFARKMNSSNPPIQVIKNDKTISAVYSKKENSYGIVCWAPSKESHLDKIPYITRVDSECTFMLRVKSKTNINISIAYPDLNLKPLKGNISWGYSIPKLITLKVKGKFKLAKKNKMVKTYQQKNITVITVFCASGIKQNIYLKAK